MLITDIHPAVGNPRQIQDWRFRKLCQSIKEFPQMLELRPIIIDNDNNILGGNMRYRALQKLGYKDIPNNWIKRASELSEEEKKRFIITDNFSYGEWDYDVLANNWDLQELTNWGVDIPNWDLSKEQEDKEEAAYTLDTNSNDYNSGNNDIEDCLFESNNKYEIPTLLLEGEAGKLILPISPWGAESRVKVGISTYHFYVDDYRFENIFKNPIKVLESGVKAIVEPNLSLYDTTPIAYGLGLIYKKRWISRYFQECGIKVYVDLNVSIKFKEYNTLGIPKGYNAYATRGYANRLEYLKGEIGIAKEISGKDTPNMLVYGGGEKVKEICLQNNIVYIEQFMTNKRENRDE